MRYNESSTPTTYANYELETAKDGLRSANTASRGDCEQQETLEIGCIAQRSPGLRSRGPPVLAFHEMPLHPNKNLIVILPLVGILLYALTETISHIK